MVRRSIPRSAAPLASGVRPSQRCAELVIHRAARAGGGEIDLLDGVQLDARWTSAHTILARGNAALAATTSASSD